MSNIRTLRLLLGNCSIHFSPAEVLVATLLLALSPNSHTPNKDNRTHYLLSGTSVTGTTHVGLIAPSVGETTRQIAGKKWRTNYYYVL